MGILVEGGYNSILTDNVQNQTFKMFIDFVNRMLLFYSLDYRGYEGFMNGSEGIAQGIVNAQKVKGFQRFLKEHDTDYDLYEENDIPYEGGILCIHR